VFYFIKVRRFGDVPWFPQTLQTNSEGLYDSRDSRNKVVTNIMADLDKAVEYLPVKSSAGGRWNKEAAMLLQARIALYEGTWEKYHANTAFGVEGANGQTFIQKAATVTDALIALGTCELDNVGVADGYWKLFNQTDYKSSKEVLFWRKYASDDNIYNRRASYSWNGAGTGLTKSMIDSYLKLDGTPVGASYDDATLQKVVAGRDPRLAQTIYVDDGNHATTDTTQFKYPGLTLSSEQRCATGYQVYKGHEPVGAGANKTCYLGTIYFRYAEALLINAEAKAELGTISNVDLDKTINLLRARVGMTAKLTVSVASDPNFEFASLSPIIQAVRRERKVELACEGFRRDDLFRWAAADELIIGKRPLGAKRAQWEGITGDGSVNDVATNVNANATGYIDPFGGNASFTGYEFNKNRDYLWSLPINEMTLNPALKPNNPGW